jgi:hypothetical protein
MIPKFDSISNINNIKVYPSDIIIFRISCESCRDFVGYKHKMKYGNFKYNIDAYFYKIIRPNR